MEHYNSGMSLGEVYAYEAFMDGTNIRDLNGLDLIGAIEQLEISFFTDCETLRVKIVVGEPITRADVVLYGVDHRLLSQLYAEGRRRALLN